MSSRKTFWVLTLALLAGAATAAERTVRFELAQPLPEASAQVSTYRVLSGALEQSLDRWSGIAGTAQIAPDAAGEQEALRWRNDQGQLQVWRRSGAVRFERALTMARTAGADTDPEKVAAEWLDSNKLRPEGAGEMVPAGTVPSPEDGRTAVVFRRRLGGLPVWGDGARAVVTVTADGRVAAVEYYWRPVEAADPVAVLAGDGATEAIRAALARTLENSDAADVVVREVSFGYFDPGPNANLESYEPQYLVRYEYTLTGEDQQGRAATQRRESLLAVPATDATATAAARRQQQR